jgi:hypothetical protein
MKKRCTVDKYEYIWWLGEKRSRLHKAGTMSYGEGVGGNYDQVELSSPGKVGRPAGTNRGDYSRTRTPSAINNGNYTSPNKR